MKTLLDALPQRMSVAVVNPLQLLRELFTVSGAGTLIRKGSRIDKHRGLGHGGSRPSDRHCSSPPSAAPWCPAPWTTAAWCVAQAEHVYLEESYLGAALLANTDIAPYLGKFAVERQAQGEGIGGEIWSMLTRDFPVFFWRARPDNPICSWYAKQCDGLARFPGWHVYWRGLPPEKIPAAIAYCMALPQSFL